MTYINPESWQPSPGILIEGKALEIVKSITPVSILAGPGAGKTELLAQRATFLLTTGLCPPPRKILAIAFKVDAARNLHERVSERCEPIQAKRFESLTLDAFAKKNVDQFLEALPDHLRPSPDYKIIFPSRDVWQEFGNRYGDTYPEIRGKDNSQLEKLVHRSMPISRLAGATTQDQQIHWAWWHDQIHSSPSSLTFDMIKLLAIYILKHQSPILSALRKTYSHVFLDEFQDVNNLQYELIKTAFLGAGSVLTAVGDSNQAIMRWAGARKDIFEQFERDFHAKDELLQFNFRSNARIVGLINSLAATFDEGYIPTECARKDDPAPEDAVQAWVFDTRSEEGEFLASYISKQLQENINLSPSDFVILARLRINDIEDRIKTEFLNQGLKIRNEARAVGGIAIQDLVKEKAYSFLLSALKLSVNVREGQPFYDCRNTVADVRGADLHSDKGHSDSLKAVNNLIFELKQITDGKSPSEVSGRELTNCILSHVDFKELQKTYREYVGGERLKSVILGFEDFFDECREGLLSWSDCISNIEGTDSVRLMTIHKSKGLEYHSVIFVEFNDDAFWGNEDDVNVFFVALSRAKERICFSISLDSKGTRNINKFCKNLESAGVLFEKK
jgi:ATP-dependent DNA helicase Rep